MQPKQLTPTELIAVSVPITSHRHWKDTGNILWYRDYQNNVVKSGIPMLGYDVLGTVTAKDIDFDVEPYVKEHGMLNNQYAFRSLLSANSLYFTNPLGLRPRYMDYSSLIQYNGDVKDWQTAENNLIEKLVILKKI